MVTANVPQIRKVTTACQVSLGSWGRVELIIYKSLLQQHQSNVFNPWYVFFSTGTSNFNVSPWIRTHYFDSRFVYFWKVVFLYLVLLSFTPVASNSFSFPSLRSRYTATLSSTCFWIFLPSRIQSGEETDVGRQRLNHSSLSLSRFSEPNKALDTNEYNRWRVFIFLPQELQTQSDLSSARNILFARITLNKPVHFGGWNKFLVPIWSPWEPNLTHRQSRCQLDLLSVNFDFRKVIFQPMVFPFVWAKCKWNFMRESCKLSFPLPLAALPLARAFSRDSLHSPKSQATVMRINTSLFKMPPI